MTKKNAVPVFKMKPSVERIVEAILFIIQEAQKRGLRVTQYDIVKTLFLADKAHLNKFGRPITYDNYTAMEHGPVPSVAYNILKEESRTIERLSVKVPWKRVKSVGKEYIYQKPARGYNDDILSESDISALSEMLTVVKSLGFAQVRRLTHEDLAYDVAWKNRGEAKSSAMSYALLFDTPDIEMAQEISFASQHI
jgi:uncharacterized phage-associated protein